MVPLPTDMTALPIQKHGHKHVNIYVRVAVTYQADLDTTRHAPPHPKTVVKFVIMIHLLATTPRWAH